MGEAQKASTSPFEGIKYPQAKAIGQSQFTPCTSVRCLITPNNIYLSKYLPRNINPTGNDVIVEADNESGGEDELAIGFDAPSPVHLFMDMPPAPDDDWEPPLGLLDNNNTDIVSQLFIVQCHISCLAHYTRDAGTFYNRSRHCGWK